MSKKILDIGCGRKKTDGSIGIDWGNNTDADVVHDLRVFPWPFEDCSFDEFRADNVVEHLPDLIRTMEEIHRIGRPNAPVHIITPHYASQASWRDPTHVHHLSWESFDYFCTENRPVEHYTSYTFKLARKKLHFGGHPMSFIGRILHYLSPRKYEARWCFIFRPSTLEVVLNVTKPES